MSDNTKIHPSAVIEKGAMLEEGVCVGAYAVIEKGVHLAKGVEIGPHAYIKGNTHIDQNTFIGSAAVIGEAPQVVGMKDNKGKLRIGKDNVIREYVTMHASMSEDGATVIGDNNFFMGFAHVAHDCQIGNNVVICNGALIAGHTNIEDRAFISGYVVVHQFVRIGRLAMVSGLARVNQDIPPFMMVVGDSRVWGINTVGLKRAGFNFSQVSNIKKAFTFLYRKNFGLKSALSKLEEIDSAEVKEIAVFILSSKRGICGPKRSSFFEKIFLDYPYLVRTKIPTVRIFKQAWRKHHKT
ncbi:MAG: acyl-ACP--UDP-N-acetylglucosamine O-acyltransferase [Candidatus Omnitrophota bacterium]|nr:MAG: acyl-ACP--UDP-N-acetylglucosamine O-acyltransferase [Candidatus Omnitrophota bacterium]